MNMEDFGCATEMLQCYPSEERWAKLYGGYGVVGFKYLCVAFFLKLSNIVLPLTLLESCRFFSLTGEYLMGLLIILFDDFTSIKIDIC